MKIDNEKAMLKLRAVSIKHQNDKIKASQKMKS